MIIQGCAIKTLSGAGNTADHIFAGERNERIEPLQGNRFDMDAMMQDARRAGKTYGFVHFKINPKDLLPPEAVSQEFTALAGEYGFALEDAVIVSHTKPRADGVSSHQHYHLIAPYVDAQGKALNLRHSYARNEKLGRLSELRTGQKLTQGQHNRAVYYRLLAEGKVREAEQVKILTEQTRACASHTLTQQRRAERQGLDLPAEKNAIRTLWAECDGMTAFLSGLTQAGYALKVGDKAGTYLIEKHGVLLGSANRLTGIRKQDFRELYLKETYHDRERPTETRFTDENLLSRPSSQRTDDRDTGLAYTGARSRPLTHPENTDASGNSHRPAGPPDPASRPAKQRLADTLARTRLNTGLTMLSTHGVGYVRNSQGELVESNELAGMNAYNAMTRLQQDMEEMERRIRAYFASLTSLSFTPISKHTVRRKQMHHTIAKEIQTARTILGERPPVLGIREIQRALEARAMQAYQQSRKALEVMQTEIQNLESKHRGVLKYLDPSYKADRDRIACLKAELPALIREAGDRNQDVDICQRLSADRAKSERERQVSRQACYDIEYNVQHYRERLPLLEDIDRDFQENDANVVERLTAEGLEAEIVRRLNNRKSKDIDTRSPRKPARKKQGHKRKTTEAEDDEEETVDVFSL
ncbi:hypothetical protein KBX73_05020 [Acetobacter persici]|uniref:hypothetical protein n=1 Tax=Acetobacter persici TaxID=1076596 RepID=UPI0020CF0CCF|nr:hypothetical protein [Acetobacter persici]MCP9319147.1 hypothetical protein [Acetobacter persici]